MIDKEKLFKSEIYCSEAELIEKRNMRDAIQRVEGDIIHRLKEEAQKLIVLEWETNGVGVDATLESVPQLLERIRGLIGFLKNAECRLKEIENEI